MSDEKYMCFYCVCVYSLYWNNATEDYYYYKSWCDAKFIVNRIVLLLNRDCWICLVILKAALHEFMNNLSPIRFG